MCNLLFHQLLRGAAHGLALLLVSVALVTPASADDYGDVQRLQAEGQTAQALKQADAYIAAHPSDPQMRFIKANVLSGIGRTKDAQAILVKLTRDYPELAEPWNNLAVLYAAQGHLDQARQALEMALSIRPDYATALENMGDLRVREAIQAYEQARGLDAGNTRLEPKIQALRRVMSIGGASTQ